MQIKAKTPEEYIDKLEGSHRSDIKKLDLLIRKTVPKLTPHTTYGMLGYGHYHYKYASGREGDWLIIGLASQKNYISLYICGANKKGYVAERYKDKLPRASIGKSCIRFKKLEDLDQDVLVEMIKEGAQAIKSSFVTK